MFSSEFRVIGVKDHLTLSLPFPPLPLPGPLRSMVEEIQSEESDDDDSSSEEETPIKTNPPNRDSRSVSLKFPFKAPDPRSSCVSSNCVPLIF